MCHRHHLEAEHLRVRMQLNFRLHGIITRVKWAVCNYDDIKPDKIFGPDSLLIYTGMNQETVRGDLGQREFFR